MSFRAVAFTRHPGPHWQQFGEALPLKWFLQTLQAETQRQLDFTAGPKRAGPAPNVAGIPRAMTARWDMAALENAGTSFSFPMLIARPGQA